MADVAGKIAHSVPLLAFKSGAQSRASVILGSGMENADMVAPRTQMQKLQVRNENSLARCARNQKLHMNTLLSLHMEKKECSTLRRRPRS